MVGFYRTEPIPDSITLQEMGTDVIPATSGEVLGAAFGQGMAANLTPRLMRAQERFAAETGIVGVTEFGAPIMVEPEPLIDTETANSQYGIKGRLSFDKPVPQSVAKDLYEHHRAAAVREDTIARREGGLLTGGAARFSANMVAGLLDPVNIATGLIPVVGEARVASLLGRSAIEAMGAAERAGMRAIAGGVSGAVGMAGLQPLEFGLSRQEHEDYTAGDALRSIAIGGLLGSGLHTVGGAVADRVSGRYANPLTQRLEEAGPEARETLLQGAVAQHLEDRPVNVAPALDVFDALRAYHGSPYEFERFDPSKIGTGEGAQAYGHGFYFAENETIAKHYQTKLAGNQIGQVLDVLPEYFKPGNIVPGYGGTLDRVLEFKREGFDWAVKVEEVNRAGKAVGRPRWHNTAPSGQDIQQVIGRSLGSLYEVALKANRNLLLDWDRPLSEQHRVVERLRMAGIPVGSLSRRGADFYHDLVDYASVVDTNTGMPSRADASKALSDAGIPGIQYLDNSSRGIGEGTRNFVIFDPENIEVIARNGDPISAMHELTSASREMPQVSDIAREATAATQRPSEALQDVERHIAEIETRVRPQPEPAEGAARADAEPSPVQAPPLEPEHVAQIAAADAEVELAHARASAFERAANCIIRGG